MINLEKVVISHNVEKANSQSIGFAEEILQSLTGQKPCITRAKRGVREWNLSVGKPTGVKVTLRGNRADGVLREFLKIRSNKIYLHQFDYQGNFSFGIGSHLFFEGQDFDLAKGVFGFNVTVSFSDHGIRNWRRKFKVARGNYQRRYTREQCIEFCKDTYNLNLIDLD